MGSNPYQPFKYVVPIGKAPDGILAPLGISSPSAASQVLTFSNNAANNETVTAGGKVYTFKTTITNTVANEVDVGATTAESIANLHAAINRGAGDGVKYSQATTENARVVATSNATTLTVTSKTPGAESNSLAVSDTVANATWGGGTLTGGSDAALLISASSEGLNVNVQAIKGAANLATSQVTSTGTAATLVAARATRRSVLITNLEDPATESAKIAYVGPATVTTANGYPILPGQSVPFTWVGLLQVIDDNTNHAVLAIADEYDD